MFSRQDSSNRLNCLTPSGSWQEKAAQEYGLIIVEGFFDAIKLVSLNYPNVVALMGSTMSEVQEKLILSSLIKFLLFLDNDETGIKATQEIHQRLLHKAFVKIAHYPAGEKYQPEDFSKEELQGLL